MSSSKFEKIVFERDMLKKENYTLIRENSKLKKDLSRKDRLVATLLNQTKTNEKEIDLLKKQIVRIQRGMKELPHVLLTTWKLLSESTNPVAKKILSSEAEESIDSIAYNFSITKEQARTVWNYLLFYR